MTFLRCISIPISIILCVYSAPAMGSAENRAKKVFGIEELREHITSYTTRWELHTTIYTPKTIVTESDLDRGPWRASFCVDQNKLCISYICNADQSKNFEVQYVFTGNAGPLSFYCIGRPRVNINIEQTLVSPCGRYKIVQREHGAFGGNRIDVYEKKEVDLNTVVEEPKKIIEPEQRTVMGTLGWGAVAAFIFGSVYKLWQEK